MAAVAYAYQYVRPSALSEGTAPKLALATYNPGANPNPYFFEGRVRQPRLVAEALTAVHVIVGSRFFTPANTVARLIALADPVVTSGGGWLRFEGFSSCCSAYIRADLSPEAYDGDVVGTGTTNVDFNAPMRAALARVRDATGLALAIGQDELTLRSSAGEVTERKVDLPTRWVRGMLEVQSYQSGMRLRIEAPAAEALRFLRTLPKASTSRTPLWIVRSSSGLYATTRCDGDGVRLTDAARLRVLHSLLPKANRLLVFADEAQQSSAWVLDFGSMKLTLALSAEVWRGFSGEGQALWSLMRAGGDDVARAMSQVRAQLRWQAALSPSRLEQDLGLDAGVVEDALRVIGASGLAGYDVVQGAYFHRVLPFDLAMVDDLHPRLADAKAIVDAGGVRVVSPSPFEAAVTSGDIAHLVRDVDGALHCTCPWFGRHQGDRGPCKHVLAAAVHRS